VQLSRRIDRTSEAANCRESRVASISITEKSRFRADGKKKKTERATPIIIEWRWSVYAKHGASTTQQRDSIDIVAHLARASGTLALRISRMRGRGGGHRNSATNLAEIRAETRVILIAAVPHAHRGESRRRGAIVTSAVFLGSATPRRIVFAQIREISARGIIFAAGFARVSAGRPLFSYRNAARCVPSLSSSPADRHARCVPRRGSVSVRNDAFASA